MVGGSTPCGLPEISSPIRILRRSASMPDAAPGWRAGHQCSGVPRGGVGERNQEMASCRFPSLTSGQIQTSVPLAANGTLERLALYAPPRVVLPGGGNQILQRNDHIPICQGALRAGKAHTFGLQGAEEEEMMPPSSVPKGNGVHNEVEENLSQLSQQSETFQSLDPINSQMSLANMSQENFVEVRRKRLR